MPDHQGIFIVLEGADGSGKTTQFNLLTERLKAVGYDVKIFDFPRYDQASSHFVKKYLNGEYGPASDINPYTASLFYALDRYEASNDIRKALNEGKIVLSNRYVGSNMAHQGSKFTSEAEQRGFFVWDDSLEYQLLGVPRPNLNIFLRVPAEMSYKLIALKLSRSYTANARDEHEADLGHLQKTVATYDSMCRLFPRDYQAINCIRNGRLLSVLAINERIWQSILPLLSDVAPRRSPKAKTIQLSKTQQIIKERPTVKKVESSPKDINHSVAISGTSLLAIRALGLLSQGTAVPALADQSDKMLNHTPVGLSSKTLLKYNQTMSFIYGNQQKILLSLENKRIGSKSVAQWAAKSIQPMSGLVTTSYRLDSAGIEKYNQELVRGSLPELKEAAKKLPGGIFPKPTGQNLKKAEPENYFNQALESLAVDHSANQDPAALNSFQPRTEFDLLADMLFEFSELSRAEVTEVVASWDYSQKAAVLKTALESPQLINPVILGKLIYDWDLLLDGPSMEHLASLGNLEQVTAQKATPRYGYETPAIIDEAGLEDIYDSCFDASLELYSTLQGAGLDNEAQYAVLYGHKQRYQAGTSYLQLKNILASARVSSAPASLKTVTDSILEMVSSAHPLIGASFTTDTVSSGEYLPNTKLSKSPSDITRTQNRPVKKKAAPSKKSSHRTRRKSK